MTARHRRPMADRHFLIRVRKQGEGELHVFCAARVRSNVVDGDRQYNDSVAKETREVITELRELGRTPTRTIERIERQHDDAAAILAQFDGHARALSVGSRDREIRRDGANVRSCRRTLLRCSGRSRLRRRRGRRNQTQKERKGKRPYE